MEIVSCDDILHLREVSQEADAKGVKLIPQLTVLTTVRTAPPDPLEITMEIVSCDDILHLREKYRREADAKGVKLIPQLTVLTTALETYEPISVKSYSCGGWQSFHAFIIQRRS